MPPFAVPNYSFSNPTTASSFAILLPYLTSDVRFESGLGLQSDSSLIFCGLGLGQRGLNYITVSYSSALLPHSRVFTILENLSEDAIQSPAVADQTRNHQKAQSH